MTFFYPRLSFFYSVANKHTDCPQWSFSFALALSLHNKLEFTCSRSYPWTDDGHGLVQVVAMTPDYDFLPEYKKGESQGKKCHVEL
jgi:hypothetical protein